ncbi:hypothetical protein [Massilia antarctica]|uniref:hypothetical protein n=1 Tax=Massilia antarctica TaxID=2765360 RepID=UPI00227142CF|nr:hypothetical protein [Massilia sp. H27-R4]MCY0910650.1 hypothetical protein [Massilia sp. H27-R4]
MYPASLNLQGDAGIKAAPLSQERIHIIKRNQFLQILTALAMSFEGAFSAHSAPVHPSDQAKKEGIAREVISEAARKELLAREEVSQAVAPIKSQLDLQRYLKMVPPKSNPLYLLSPTARERFLASVTFNEKGLTGFGFEDLQRELSQAQIAKVLALFGSESSAKYIKPSADTRAPGPGDSNNCVENPGELAPVFCEDGDGDGGFGGFDGPSGGGGGGGGGGAGGCMGCEGTPRIPPVPPDKKLPGALDPIMLANGDVYHMYCDFGGSTCSPMNFKLCKAKC